MKRLTVLALTLCTGILLASAPPAAANNLVITNLSLVNVSNGTANLQFDLSWDNSWRASWSDNGDTVTVTNWDAAWVFAKFRQSGGLWKHAALALTGHGPTGGTAIDAAGEGGTAQGAFVYRAAEGSGRQECAGMTLRWDYEASGISGTNEVDIAVMGIEMVYIPGGSFWVGSGGTEIGHLYRYPDESTPYLVTNEDAIVVGTTTGAMYYSSGGDQQGPIPAAFPKGTTPFYCMKYELSAGQYVDFLNLLDPGIAPTYFANSYPSIRYTIQNTNSVYESDAPDRACNHLTGAMILTYFDWAGLRPMTELEFEKVCRGVRTPWINEFAWGNTTVVYLNGFNGLDGSGSETATATNANIHLSHSGGAPYGPVRVGLFATTNSTRETSGAGYYGNMDLSGNLGELAVSISRPEGRAFSDVYGDYNEYTDPTTQWPVIHLRAYTAKGGGSPDDDAYLIRARVSDRTYSDGYGIYSGSAGSRGARGVRRAP